MFYVYTFLVVSATSCCCHLCGVQMLNLIKFIYGSLKFFFLELHSVKCLIKNKFSLLFDSLKLFYWNISLLINTKLTFMPACSIKKLIENCNHFAQQMDSAHSITLQKEKNMLFRKRTKEELQSWLAADIKPEHFCFHVSHMTNVAS